jgi:hypothetical protein
VVSRQNLDELRKTKTSEDRLLIMDAARAEEGLPIGSGSPVPPAESDPPLVQRTPPGETRQMGLVQDDPESDEPEPESSSKPLAEKAVTLDPNVECRNVGVPRGKISGHRAALLQQEAADVHAQNFKCHQDASELLQR